MTDRATCQRWLGHLGVALLLSTAFFTAFPLVDLRAAMAFGTPGAGFAFAGSAELQALRLLMILSTDGLMSAVLIALLVGIMRPTLRIVDLRVLAFCLTSYALGPGLLVNGVLKSISERARPRDLIEFGGQAHYAPPFELSGQCSENCSFVSGETSALVTVATILLLVVVPQLPSRWHGTARAAILAVTLVGALLRIAFGAHFPSDVIFAGLTMSASVVCLYLAFGLDAPAPRFKILRRPARKMPGIRVRQI